MLYVMYLDVINVNSTYILYTVVSLQYEFPTLTPKPLTQVERWPSLSRAPVIAQQSTACVGGGWWYCTVSWPGVFTNYESVA